MKRWGLAAVALLIAALAALAFLALTATGFRWFAGALDGLSGGRIVLSGVDGHLGSPLTIRRLTLVNEMRRVEVENLRFEWQPRALWEGRLDVDLLAARRARITTLKEDDAPPQLPESLRLPVDVSVRVFDLGTLDIVGTTGQTQTFRRMRASLADDGSRYRFEDVTLVTPWADVQGRLTLGKDAPFALAARVDAVRTEPVEIQGRLDLAGTLSALRFELQARAETMRLMARGEAAPFSAVRLPRLLVAGEGLDPRLFAPDAPAADIAFSGVFEGRPGERMLGTFSLTNRGAGPLDQEKLPLVDLTAAVAGTWTADGVQADFSALVVDLGPGGALTGSGHWRDGQASVALAGTGLDLSAVHTALQPTRLRVALQLTGDAQAQQLEADIAEARGQGRLALIHADDTVQLKSARFSGDFGELTATGTVRLDAAREFSARVDAARIDPSRLGEFPRASLNARGEFSGQLEPRLRVNAKVTLPRGELEGRPVVGSGQFQYADRRLSGVDVDVDLAGNRATMQGAYGRAGDSLSWRIDAPALARLRLGFGGRLQSSGTLAGDPARLQVDARLQAADLRLPGAVAAERVDARVLIGARPQDVFEGEIDARNIRRGEQRLNSLRARFEGRRNAHTITIDARLPEWRLNARAAGALEGVGTCPGDVACPVRWRGRLTEAALDGAWPMRLVAPAVLSLSRERQQVDGLTLTVAGGEIAVAHFVREGDTWSTRGRFDGLPLAPLLALAPQQDRVAGDLRVGGNWDVRAGATLDGTLQLRRQSGDVRLTEPALALGLNALTLDVVAANSVADVRLALATRDGGRLRLDGRAELQREGLAFVLPRTTPVAWTADIDVPDLRLARAFLPVGTRLDAVVEAHLTGRGTLAAPSLDGTLDARGIRFAMPEEGVAITDGVLRLTLDAGRVRVREGVLHGSSGRVLVSGDAALESREAGLDLRFERFAVTRRSDREVLVSGLTRLRLDPQGMALTGELTADRARVSMPEASRPKLSSDVVVVGRPPREQPAVDDVPLALDLTLNLGDDFLFEGAGLDARLGGELRVFTVEQRRPDRREGERLAAHRSRVLRAEGTIRVEEGRYSAYAQTLDIERGVLRFVGPIDNPGLDVLAVRKIEEVKVGVQVGGTVQRPVVTLVSEPPMPDTEKLSWLVLGHGLEGGDQQEFALLQVAAGALLSRAESVNVQARLADALGIDTFDVRAGSGEDLAGTVVSLGKRLSSRATLSYEQSVDGLRQVVKVLYQLSPHVRLEAQAGQPSSFDAFYTREYD